MDDPVAEVPADDKENRNLKRPALEGYKAPWVEAYRPRSLDDVLGNEETILRLRAIAKDGNMPNLILCGPPGTGALSRVVVVEPAVGPEAEHIDAPEQFLVS